MKLIAWVVVVSMLVLMMSGTLHGAAGQSVQVVRASASGQNNTTSDVNKTVNALTGVLFAILPLIVTLMVIAMVFGTVSHMFGRFKGDGGSSYVPVPVAETRSEILEPRGYLQDQLKCAYCGGDVDYMDQKCPHCYADKHDWKVKA